MNNNIPKSGIFKSTRRSQKPSQRQLNHSLNISSTQLNDQFKSRDKSQKPNNSTVQSTKSKTSQQICAKFDRENSRSVESLKNISNSSSHKKKSLKKKRSGTLTASLNSSKIQSQSQCTLENQSEQTRVIKKKTQKMNLSFQSINNATDITANFQSLQNSQRLNQNINQDQQKMMLQPFNTYQGGQRASSQGNIINIQTPQSQQEQYYFTNSQQLGYIQAPNQVFYQANQGSTDRSMNSVITNVSRGIAPITATLINPSVSSYPESTMNQANLAQMSLRHQINQSVSQQNTYSPVNQKFSARHDVSSSSQPFQTTYNQPTFQGSAQKSHRIQTNSVSPAKVIQAHPISFLTTLTPNNLTQISLTQSHGAFLLQKLELFWKDRLMRLGQHIQQLRDQAFQQDDIIRTMLENQETIDFADQRIIELIKEGIHIEQELQIEQISKQLIIAQNETLQIAQQRDHFANDFNKLVQDHQQYKQETITVVNELKQKKNKYKAKMLVIEEYKNELKKVREERDNLLEKLKMFQNQNSEKINQTECKIEEMQRLFQEQEIHRDQMQGIINSLREEIVMRESQYKQEINEQKQREAEQLEKQKNKIKEKYKDQLENLKIEIKNEKLHKINELKQLTESKHQSQSQLEKQTLDFLQNEIATLKLKLEDTISITEHESILNSQLSQVRTIHEREIEMIKEAFEKELRKAEKQVRSSVKKEEDKLRQSVNNFKQNIEKVKFEKSELEKQMREDIMGKDAQIKKLRELISDRDVQYSQELSKYKDRVKQQEVQIQQIDMMRKDELEKANIEHTKAILTLSFQVKELQSKIQQTQQELDVSRDQIIREEQLIKDKELQLSQLQQQFIQLEAEFNEYQKRQLEKSSLLNNRSEEINSLNKEIIGLRMKVQDIKNQQRWKLDRELEKVRRVKQEILLIKKLLLQDMEFSSKETNQNLSQNLQTFIQKYEKQIHRLTISHSQQINQITTYYDQEKQKLSLELMKSSELNTKLEQELGLSKLKQEQMATEFIVQQQSLEQHYEEEIKRLNEQLSNERNNNQDSSNQLVELNDEFNQVRQDNQSLHQRVSDLDQQIQELDFKLKNCESEKDLFKQQLAFEERQKHEESSQLRSQFQAKQDQLIADFKEQCMKLRGEIEETYQQKLKNKIASLKIKQEEEISQIILKFEDRDREYNEKAEQQKSFIDQIILQHQSEMRKLKKDYKKVLLKYKQSIQRDQENVSKIEEEVFKSLAKVNQSVQINTGRRQSNKSEMMSNQNKSFSNIRSQSRMVDRTFQNITNHSMFINNPSSRERNEYAQQSLILQSNRNYVNQSFNTLSGTNSKQNYQNTYSQSPYSQLQDNQRTNRTVKENNSLIDQKQQQQSFGTLRGQKNLQILNNSSLNNQSQLLQELNSITANSNNNFNSSGNQQNNMSLNLRKISPISKSLNQTDISEYGVGNSSFIFVGQNQSQVYQNSQYQQQFDQKSQNHQVPPLHHHHHANQNSSHLSQQHSNLMQHVQKKNTQPQMTAVEKQKLRQQIDQDKQLSQRSYKKRNPLQQSSLNQILNISQDLVIGGGEAVYGTDSFMDCREQDKGREVFSQSDASNQNQFLKGSLISENSQGQPTIANGGVLLNSGMNNDESFLIARSLSPGEKTGKFGSIHRDSKVKSQNKTLVQ